MPAGQANPPGKRQVVWWVDRLSKRENRRNSKISEDLQILSNRLEPLAGT